MGWHFDFHVPENVRVFEKSEPRELAASLAAAGVEEVTFFAKCHFGYAYHPTKVATSHPRLCLENGDVLGRLLQECRAKGLRVLIYISFGIDREAARQHPEWKRVYEDGHTDSSDWFVYVCAFTPYLEECLLPQLEELIDLYKPDGFWFDTMSAFRPCYCKSCRAGFENETGSPPPVDEDDALQPLFGLWRHERGMAVLEKIAGRIEARLPGATVCFNQIGSLPYPEKLPAGLNWLSLDPATTGTQSVAFSLYASFGTSTQTPCDVIPTIFNQGWGDWSLASPARNAQIAAATWARGARLFPGDRLHPEGRLTPHSQIALQQFAQLRNDFAQHSPAEDAEPAPDALLLHCPSAIYGDNCEYFGRLPKSRLTNIEGVHRLMLDAGYNSWVVAEHALDNWLSRTRLVVLPEVTSIESSTNTALKNWVQRGGELLVVGNLPLVEDGTLDWCGVQGGEMVWQDHAYLPAWSSTELPVLVRGGINNYAINGADPELNLIASYDAAPGTKYGWDIGPPSDSPSDHPALTRYSVGEGTVWFCPAALCNDYARTGNWQLMQWWKGLLSHIAFKPRVILRNSPGNIELVVWKESNTLWAILVNHQGEQIIGSNGTSWARHSGLWPVCEVTLHVDAASTSAVLLDGKPHQATYDGQLKITVPLTGPWHVVQIN